MRAGVTFRITQRFCFVFVFLGEGSLSHYFGVISSMIIFTVL
jgi:hypothetical protein